MAYTKIELLVVARLISGPMRVDWIKCDTIKQNESEHANIKLEIQWNKADNLFCFLLFLQSLKMVLLENQMPNLHGVFAKLNL